MPESAITESNREIFYTAVADQTGFAVDFKFQQAGDLSFGILGVDDAFTPLSLGVDYTVTGADADAGGTIHLLVPATAGTKYRVRGEAALEQNKYLAGARYAPDAINSLFERCLIWAVEQYRDVQSVVTRMDGLVAETWPQFLTDLVYPARNRAEQAASDAENAVGVATDKAAEATAQATISTTKAGEAAASATQAVNAQAAAEVARDEAQAAQPITATAKAREVLAEETTVGMRLVLEIPDVAADSEKLGGELASLFAKLNGGVFTGPITLDLPGHVNDGGNDYGLFVKSYEPAITLIDKSPGQYSGLIGFFTDRFSFKIDSNNDGTIGHSTNTTTKDALTLIYGSEAGYLFGEQIVTFGNMPASTPAGTIIAFAATATPNGYLSCYGQAISRTTYAALFAVIGTAFGEGDGSTTFNLPDLRGEFLRGWDNSRGVDSGRAIGTWQDDAFESHTHGAGSYQAVIPGGSNSHSGWAYGQYNSSGLSYLTVTGTSGSTGGSETRPRNVAVHYCIKY